MIGWKKGLKKKELGEVMPFLQTRLIKEREEEKKTPSWRILNWRNGSVMGRSRLPRERKTVLEACACSRFQGEFINRVVRSECRGLVKKNHNPGIFYSRREKAREAAVRKGQG